MIFNEAPVLHSYDTLRAVTWTVPSPVGSLSLQLSQSHFSLTLYFNTALWNSRQQFRFHIASERRTAVCLMKTEKTRHVPDHVLFSLFSAAFVLFLIRVRPLLHTAVVIGAEVFSLRALPLSSEFLIKNQTWPLGAFCYLSL